MQKMQKGMLDLKHIADKMKPNAENPDEKVSLLRVVRALASAPILAELPTEPAEQKEAAEAAAAEVTNDILGKLEKFFIKAGALKEGDLSDCDAIEGRNTLLLYFHMYQSNPTMKELVAEMPGGVEALRAYVNRQATNLLIKAQMLMPQQRWVQPTLAIAGASALISTALWSHTEEASLAAMTSILKEDSLTFPKLTLSAKCGPKATQGEGDEVPTGQQVLTVVSLKRLHASAPGEGTAEPPVPNNPQGIFEAYWLYIEGLKPEGTPNSLICAQPMVVKDLTADAITAEAPFTAPPVPGTYTLRVHVTSTSVIGVDLSYDVSFTVVEDDVPALQ